jgi:hypothetical protein
MSKEDSVDSPDEEAKDTKTRRRHPITMSNSPEETMRRMASFPERAAKFRERLRALRESKSPRDS